MFPSVIDQFFIYLYLKVLNRGKFKKVGATLSVQAGDTLELRCRGRPVQWGVPTYLEEDDEGRLR